MSTIYDVTLSISAGLPVWPGDPLPQLTPRSSLSEGDAYNLSMLHISTHTGTHVDAPRHVFQAGATVDQLPLEVLVGDAWVCYLPDSLRTVTRAALEAAAIPPETRRLLLRTANSELWDRSTGEFTPDYVALSEDAAHWVVARGVRLLGIDYLSVDPATSVDLVAHRTLLSHGVVVVESIDLRLVPAGAYRMCCLPLKLEGADGAPARVVLVAEAAPPSPRT